MSLRARLDRIRRHLPEAPCNVCGEPSGKVRLRLDLLEVEDYDRDAPENQHGGEAGVRAVAGSRYDQASPLIQALRAEHPDADTLHCPECGRVVFRRLRLNLDSLGHEDNSY